MAIATTYVAINMNNWQFYEWSQDPTFSSTHITEYLVGGRRSEYYGSGFTIDTNTGDVTGGTLNRTDHFLNGVLQYRVTGLVHSADLVDFYVSNDNPQILPYLFSGNDTFAGSAYADTLNGYAGNDNMMGNGGGDLLNGLGGNDILNGGAGSDILNGGTGNDTMIWGGASDSYNGSTGTDILKLLGGNLDLMQVVNTLIKNTETINMTAGGNNRLTVTKSDVLALSSTTDQLTVLGNAGDSVDLRGTGWVLDSTVGAFEFWKNGTAIVKAELELNVI